MNLFVFDVIAFIAGITALFYPRKITDPEYDPEIDLTPPTMPIEPENQTVAASIDTPQPLPWDTAPKAWHGFRVLCDLAKLTVEEKNLLSACVYQESEFLNTAVCNNRNAAGVITSSDVGICQVNSFFHCGPGKDFPSTEFVIQNPDQAAKWMIKCYQEGLLKMWVSYSSSAYKKWLLPDSPMWSLANPS